MMPRSSGTVLTPSMVKVFPVPTAREERLSGYSPMVVQSQLIFKHKNDISTYIIISCTFSLKIYIIIIINEMQQKKNHLSARMQIWYLKKVNIHCLSMSVSNLSHHRVIK